MEKKYKLTDETRIIGNSVLHRIEALKSFSNVEKGDKGGWVESENSLSHKGDAWVYNEACVYEQANVSGNAKVQCNAIIYGSAKVQDDALIKDQANIADNAVISCNAVIGGYATIRGNACVYDDVIVCDNAYVRDNAEVHGTATICGTASVFDDTVVSGKATICGSVCLHGSAKIIGDAVVRLNEDYIVLKNWWSSGRYFTWTRSNNKWAVGCFYGTGEELIAKAYKDSELSGKEYERAVKYVESILND